MKKYTFFNKKWWFCRNFGKKGGIIGWTLCIQSNTKLSTCQMTNYKSVIHKTWYGVASLAFLCLTNCILQNGLMTLSKSTCSTHKTLPFPGLKSAIVLNWFNMFILKMVKPKSIPVWCHIHFQNLLRVNYFDLHKEWFQSAYGHKCPACSTSSSLSDRLAQWSLYNMHCARYSAQHPVM